MVETRTEMQRHRSANGTKSQQSRIVLAMHARQDMSEIDGLDARILRAHKVVVQIDVDVASHQSRNQYVSRVCDGCAEASHRHIFELLVRTCIIALITNINGRTLRSKARAVAYMKVDGR